MSVNPDKLLRAVCPDGSTVTSHPSSRAIGTAYGKWLGVTYMKELQSRGEPKTYGIVDFDVFSGSTSWEPGSIFSLHEVDPLVAGAMSVSEWLRGWRQRTDILNSDTDEVYEIKPLRSRDEGVGQLQGYLNTLRALAPTTSPVFGPPRARNWRGGSWDPSRYPLIIGGLGGQKTCVIHAWQDPQVQGLIVYDIKCCVRNSSDERPELQPTRVAYVVPEIEQEMRPVFEEWTDESDADGRSLHRADVCDTWYRLPATDWQSQVLPIGNAGWRHAAAAERLDVRTGHDQGAGRRRGPPRSRPAPTSGWVVSNLRQAWASPRTRSSLCVSIKGICRETARRTGPLRGGFSTEGRTDRSASDRQRWTDRALSLRHRRHNRCVGYLHNDRLS